MIYKAIIIWETGEKEEYEYKTEEEAKLCVQNYKVSFGNQIEWADISKRSN